MFGLLKEGLRKRGKGLGANRIIGQMEGKVNLEAFLFFLIFPLVNLIRLFVFTGISKDEGGWFQRALCSSDRGFRYHVEGRGGKWC